ncbi:hypothetical protein swp_2880 [Shewanella piezotolerans WP3]|uniref:Uncharacterized protein n=1 Tax=Shewanella piezotolerans (strain WP3 / JCM 13877) TaxID=225849 RepID=B8CPN0_SHEPW|nr:hypothetical protein swp_2880 [Shewanella piezotolerans WP3]
MFSGSTPKLSSKLITEEFIIIVGAHMFAYAALLF